MTRVDFWFDPTCPWAWVTSRWVLEVQKQRQLDLHWHVMSLAILNEGRDVAADYQARVQRGKAAGRVLMAAQQRCGEDVLLPLYTSMGTRFHPGQEPVARETIEAALRDAELPAELAQAVDSADYDEALKASHQTGIELVGQDVGTPIVSIEGRAFFGPVIDAIPRGEAATHLWDGLVLLTQADGFYELKRTRDRRPTFD